ncbi:MAG: YkgJ family cysteine cluster protein [Deltaproteobacteria bacterium]|nr:YkgJ family cysteine cluster protein [Deltaproteobacteria bacterium]
MAGSLINDEEKIRAMQCLRCGVCCTRHQAIVNLDEIKRIASYLGISSKKWIQLYSDPRWLSPKSYLIKHDGAGCIFLDISKGGFSYCKIQPVKPFCCLKWVPSMAHKECREGMLKHIIPTQEAENVI